MEGPGESSPDAATGVSTRLDASAGGGAVGGNGGSSSDASSGSGGEFGDVGGEPDAGTEATSIDAGPTGSDASGIPLTTPLTDAGTAPLGP